MKCFSVQITSKSLFNDDQLFAVEVSQLINHLSRDLPAEVLASLDSNDQFVSMKFFNSHSFATSAKTMLFKLIDLVGNQVIIIIIYSENFVTASRKHDVSRGETHFHEKLILSDIACRSPLTDWIGLDLTRQRVVRPCNLRRGLDSSRRAA